MQGLCFISRCSTSKICLHCRLSEEESQWHAADVGDDADDESRKIEGKGSGIALPHQHHPAYSFSSLFCPPFLFLGYICPPSWATSVNLFICLSSLLQCSPSIIGSIHPSIHPHLYLMLTVDHLFCVSTYVSLRRSLHPSFFSTCWFSAHQRLPFILALHFFRFVIFRISAEDEDPIISVQLLLNLIEVNQAADIIRQIILIISRVKDWFFSEDAIQQGFKFPMTYPKSILKFQTEHLKDI